MGTVKSGLGKADLVEEELRNIDIGTVISSCYAKAVLGTSIDWDVTVEPVQAILRLLFAKATNCALALVLVIQTVSNAALVLKLAGSTLIGPFLGDSRCTRIFMVPSLFEVGGGGGA